MRNLVIESCMNDAVGGGGPRAKNTEIFDITTQSLRACIGELLGRCIRTGKARHLVPCGSSDKYPHLSCIHSEGAFIRARHNKRWE